MWYYPAPCEMSSSVHVAQVVWCISGGNWRVSLAHVWCETNLCEVAMECHLSDGLLSAHRSRLFHALFRYILQIGFISP